MFDNCTRAKAAALAVGKGESTCRNTKCCRLAREQLRPPSAAYIHSNLCACVEGAVCDSSLVLLADLVQRGRAPGSVVCLCVIVCVKRCATVCTNVSQAHGSPRNLVKVFFPSAGFHCMSAPGGSPTNTAPPSPPSPPQTCVFQTHAPVDA